MGKKRERVSIGPFVSWMKKHMPKCLIPQNKHSTMNMGRKQRDYVLKLYGYDSYNAYLQSDLWQQIRVKILSNTKCVCGKDATQVHHKKYSESNLLGITSNGLFAICHNCHYEIEFSEKRKCSLGEANLKLKQKQFESVADLEPPNSEEIKQFLSGGRKMTPERKLVVRRHFAILRQGRKQVLNDISLSRF